MFLKNNGKSLAITIEGQAILIPAGRHAYAPEIFELMLSSPVLEAAEVAGRLEFEATRGKTPKPKEKKIGKRRTKKDSAHKGRSSGSVQKDEEGS